MHRCGWFLSAQVWFFNAVIDSRVDLFFRLFSTLPLVCLVAGLVLAKRRPHRILWWAAVSFGISIGYLAFAGSLRGAIPKGILLDWGATALLWSFAALQIGCVVTLVWRSRGSRRAAALLGGFCLPYAVFCFFVGAMSLADSWF